MAGGDAVFVRDLFNKFQTYCGACHIEQSLGDPPWQVSWSKFSIYVDDAISSMRSDTDFMPPAEAGGKPWSDRESDGVTDPIEELESLFEAWNAAGNPTDVFYPANLAGKSAEGSAFVMEPDVATGMTNLGNCIPPKAMVGTDESKMDALDELFAKAGNCTEPGAQAAGADKPEGSGCSGLPDKLEDTDLFTLDSEQLARRGVVAYAPAYTLWADNAKKVRMVRVPRGSSIAFDADTQSFSIPPNTRFYKTFLKRVIDLDGNESYRKMETRLIVSRPDMMKPDGTRQPQALFGTYAWNEEETEATLVRDPLRNGAPFVDRMVTYVTDEKKAYDVISDAPKDLVEALYPSNERDLSKLLLRSYAIPGSERCVQCHMGSGNASFVLGFTPLQVHRQREGTHGVIEAADEDELNQLQRLIDYGVVSGISSPSDVKLLEDSQGKRKPRNDHELAAQGYMLGNCAHCHNPLGFPTQAAPELRDLLNFLPSDRGGIFQFPLDRYSPRIHRGEFQNIQVPYITPSLFDFQYSPTSPGADDIVAGAKKQNCTDAAAGCMAGEEQSREAIHIYAPWRSLIYRNVDSPFSYVADSAIYPHMPRNTPGYDCRSRQLLGTWMASVPSRLATGFPASDDAEIDATDGAQDFQPYVEVAPADENYDRAVKEAATRVKKFQDSPRYNDCPAPELDIIDRSVRDDPNKTKPDDYGRDDDNYSYSLPIPAREHWFVTDLTEAPGDWQPRRVDWRDVFSGKVQPRNAEEQKTLQLLLKGSVRATGDDELRKLALTDVPFGEWAEGQRACSFPSSVRTVDSYKPEERARWMSGTPKHSPAPGAHVFDISPGGQIFSLICRSCHGPEADSKSRLADTIADLTGGETRVANLRDGLFGPKCDPQQGCDASANNIKRVFSDLTELEAIASGLTPEDWAARYVVWMGLGGTQRTIPEAIVRLVTINTVLGWSRSGHTSLSSGSANMLDTAKFLCGAVLGTNEGDLTARDLTALEPITAQTSDDPSYVSALVYENGDAELWEHLCRLHNPQPVRMLLTSPDAHGEITLSSRTYSVTQGSDTKWVIYLYKRDGYGSNPVGDQDGNVTTGLTDANVAPWCIQRPSDATVRQSLEDDWKAKHPTSTPPYCPETLIDPLADPSALPAGGQAPLQLDDVEGWKKRGAMNAGLSAFLYLEALRNGDKQRQPDYDRCEELKP